ncbi:SGNH/GDSL hydrolase family protein [Neolewinella sp.]|uniref:SGNH/GDSL hydrolase family protein n=1 Tax=Neolewinella sp. TaxID=2993543 RepID=UPI003B51FA75
MFKAWYYPLLLLFLLAGCTSEDDPIVMKEQLPPMAVDTTISYLALGDSYTIGTSVQETERWPRQLAQALQQRERIGVQPLEIVARNGWRTDNLSNALADDPPAGPYDLVSLLIGVNDQYQGFGVSGYTERFEDLLQQAIALAGGDTSAVFVVSIPDYAFTPFGGGSEAVSREIDAFNQAAQAVAEGYDVPFYNITPISRRGLAEPDLVASDKLHPSARQYRLWVEEVLLGQVTAQLRRSR